MTFLIKLITSFAFPGIFKDALSVRASDINEAMKVAASKAIASLVATDDLRADYVISDALDPLGSVQLLRRL